MPHPNSHARRRLVPHGPNAVAILWTEPAWSLAMAWQTSYLTVYLVRMGLTPAGVGAAVGASAVVQVAGLLVSGYLVDHLGRKTVIMAGDFIGWVLTLGLWVMDPRPLILALGVVLLNGFAFVTPAWNSLFAEDVEPSRVSYYFLVLQQLTLFGGLVVPIMAPVVAHMGVRASGHLALAISWPLVAVAWLLRVWWLRESSVGHAQRAARRAGTHPPVGARLRAGLSGANLVLAILRVLIQVSVGLWATFAPLILVAHRAEALAPSALAFLPLGSTVAGGVVLVLQRRWRQAVPARVMGVALLMMVAGMATVSLVPAGQLIPVLAAWALVAAGQALFWTLHTTQWMGALPDAARVDVQAWVGAVSAVLMAVLAPLLAGLLPEMPRSINGTWTALTALGLLVLVIGRRQMRSLSRS